MEENKVYIFVIFAFLFSEKRLSVTKTTNKLCVIYCLDEVKALKTY